MRIVASLILGAMVLFYPGTFSIPAETRVITVNILSDEEARQNPSW